jgi:hypothetical protein
MSASGSAASGQQGAPARPFPAQPAGSTPRAIPPVADCQALACVFVAQRGRSRVKKARVCQLSRTRFVLLVHRAEPHENGFGQKALARLTCERRSR